MRRSAHHRARKQPWPCLVLSSSGQDSGHTKASSGWKNFRCLVGVSAHPLPIAPLWRRVGEVDHDPRLACDPMKAFEGSIDDVYQRLEKDSSMPASIAAASSAAAMGERGSRSDITRPIASLWTGSTMRSEEHTSELQSLMRSSYAVFCLKKKKKTE